MELGSSQAKIASESSTEKSYICRESRAGRMLFEFVEVDFSTSRTTLKNIDDYHNSESRNVVCCYSSSITPEFYRVYGRFRQTHQFTPDLFLSTSTATPSRPAAAAAQPSYVQESHTFHLSQPR